MGDYKAEHDYDDDHNIYVASLKSSTDNRAQLA